MISFLLSEIVELTLATRALPGTAFASSLTKVLGYSEVIYPSARPDLLRLLLRGLWTFAPKGLCKADVAWGRDAITGCYSWRA